MLHGVFKRYIGSGEFEKSRLFGRKYDFEKLHDEYIQSEHSVLSDCEYITCAALEFCAETAAISKNYTVIKI